MRGRLSRSWAKFLKSRWPRKSRYLFDFIGAGRGNRTPTSFQKLDFESSASTSSAIPAILYRLGLDETAASRKPHSICAVQRSRQSVK